LAEAGIQWVNLTTRLPVGRGLVADVARRLGPSFTSWLAASRLSGRTRREADSIRILLLSKADFRESRPPRIPTERTRDELTDGTDPPDTDALAYYTPHHWRLHRPAIIMSPEILLSALVNSLIPNCSPPGLGNRCRALDLYPEVLAFVAIHELAHGAMCSEAHLACSADGDWAAVADAIDRGEQTRGKDALKASTLFRHDCSCNWVWARRLPPPLAHSEELIEESLATAIALSHFPPGPVRRFLDMWVSRQSPPYRAGLLWHLGFEDLISAGKAWARMKSSLARSGSGNAKMQISLQNLANELLGGRPIKQIPHF